MTAFAILAMFFHHDDACACVHFFSIAAFTNKCFISENDGIAFSLKLFPLLGGFSAIQKFCTFSATSQIPLLYSPLCLNYNRSLLDLLCSSCTDGYRFGMVNHAG